MILLQIVALQVANKRCKHVDRVYVLYNLDGYFTSKLIL